MIEGDEEDNNVIQIIHEISKQEEEEDDDLNSQMKKKKKKNNNEQIDVHDDIENMSIHLHQSIKNEQQYSFNNNNNNNEELKPLQKGHQTRRVFIIGKNIPEFILILKARKLKVKKECVVNDQGCVSFKNPVSTDFILDLRQQSSLDIQAYTCKRAKGVFASFFSSLSSLSSSKNKRKTKSNSNSNSSHSMNDLMQTPIGNDNDNNNNNNSYLESESSASTDYLMKMLEQKRQQQQEDLICLLREHQVQQSQLLQQNNINNEDERRVYDRILNVINENPLWSIAQITEHFKQTNLEKITLVLHVIGKNRQILDDIISIYQGMDIEGDNNDAITTSTINNQEVAEDIQATTTNNNIVTKNIRINLTGSQLDKHKNRITKKSIITTTTNNSAQQQKCQPNQNNNNNNHLQKKKKKKKMGNI